MKLIKFNKIVYEEKFFYNLINSKYQNFVGNGIYTSKFEKFMKKKYKLNNFILTTSCTASLEMAAILINIKPNDEIIMPSYTFPSSANAFVLRGAKIKFVDSLKNHPNMDPDKIEKLINSKTKCILVVHYAGISCDMDKILAISKKYNLKVIEDAAQCIDSYFKKKALGSVGDIGCISFHETKNFSCGEGGGLFVNRNYNIKRARVLRDKGTNRFDFQSGKVSKYQWVDIGSSYAPSDLLANILHHHKKEITSNTKKRLKIWKVYYNNLRQLEVLNLLELPKIPKYSSNNGHIFYIVCKNLNMRDKLIKYMKKNNVVISPHYQCLHISKFFRDKHGKRLLRNAFKYQNRLVRLPIYENLTSDEQKYIINKINNFFLRYRH